MKKNIVLNYDTEQIDEMRKRRKEDEVANFYTDNAANEQLSQILNRMDIDHQKIQDEMYPALWDKMKEETIKILDIVSVATTSALEETLYKILEEEPVHPVQAVEDRPIQSEEDKKAGLLHINRLEVPESLKQQNQPPQLPDINIYEEFKGKSIEEIVDIAYDKVIIDADLSKVECYDSFKEDLVENKALDDVIKAETISVDELDKLMEQVTMCTNPQFAELFVWSIFEMPSAIKELIDSFKQMQTQMQANTVINSDEKNIFINPSFKGKCELVNDAINLIKDNIHIVFDTVKELTENESIDKLVGKTVLNIEKDIIDALTSDFRVINGIINEFISKEDFNGVIEKLTDIITSEIDKKEKENLSVEMQEERDNTIRICAFNTIHLFFPPTIQKISEESVESGKESEE